VPLHQQISSPSTDRGPATAPEQRRSTSPDNSVQQRRLGQTTGDRDAAGDGASHDLWGGAIAAESEVLAPYYVEITEGQVARHGQRDGVVPWLQGALQRLGYSAQQTSVFDDATLAALEEWQRLNGVAVTGELGPTTLGVLEQAIEASINLQQFQENAPGIPEATLREYLPHLNASMLKAGISSDTRKAVYIAQLGHESDGFNTLEEYASGAGYEGREDLGNIHPGDGRRFKGRGPIQITGRDNYTSYGAAIGEDLVSDPELAATPEIGFQLAAEYWNRNDLNRYADRGQFDTVTARINGGQNGRPDRRRRWARAKSTLRDWEQTPDVVTRPSPRPDDLGQDEVFAPRLPPTDAFDGVFEQLVAGDYEAAMAAAEAAAAEAHEAGEPTVVASRVRDIGRHMLDAQTAFDEEHFDKAMAAAHEAARTARWLRDNDMVRGNTTDPLVAKAGQLWTRAEEAARTHGNAADIALLEAALPLRRGDRGEAVAALQRLLGMDVAGGAGIFGPATEAAVRDYQRAQGLGADGIVGGGTLDALRG
jgi:predicted chitinase/peptidoglycan hydrolase-like protein with peptidoglycan-binding domain